MSKKLIVERDVETPMRDGVVLRADVYRLDSVDPLPILLQRTPYGKGFSQNSFALMAAERGYAVVIQDTRGMWASEGQGYPFIYEREDGYDSVEWAASQPWANGKAGMFGGSYVGMTQLAAASMNPPSLKTIVPAITTCNPVNILYGGGEIQLVTAVSWSLLAWALQAIMRSPANPTEKAQLMGQLITLVDGMSQGETFKFQPIIDLPLIGRNGLVNILSDAYAHPPFDPYWQLILYNYETLKIPIFHIGGWYDLFIASTLSDYVGIRQQGNLQQKVLIGPWYHGPYDNLVGEVDFGLQASGMLVLPDEIQLRWFDYWLKGINNGIMQEPPLQIFVMGDNLWRTENEWPLRRTHYSTNYLHSQGAANTLHGNGTLNMNAPSIEPVDSFVYDPNNPVPTRGGNTCCWSPALPPGAYDQRKVEERPDVLVYTSLPLENDLEVTGPIEVHLWASSNAPDTDFTAKLVDVGPCGYARNVQDGIQRAKYRVSGGSSLLIPGEVYEFTISLGATSNVFKTGHRLRLEISSSNFPRFDRNTNTGQPPGTDVTLRPAYQTIFHDSEHPSHIILPNIPR